MKTPASRLGSARTPPKPSATYPIRAVSLMLGVSIDTLRAWERRYGAVTPARDERGRMYTDADIRRIRLLHHAVENGHAIGRVAHLTNEALEQIAETSAASHALVTSEPTAITKLRARQTTLLLTNYLSPVGSRPRLKLLVPLHSVTDFVEPMFEKSSWRSLEVPSQWEDHAIMPMTRISIGSRRCRCPTSSAISRRVERQLTLRCATVLSSAHCRRHGVVRRSRAI